MKNADTGGEVSLTVDAEKPQGKIYRNELDHERFKWQTASEGGEEETDNENNDMDE